MYSVPVSSLDHLIFSKARPGSFGPAVRPTSYTPRHRPPSKAVLLLRRAAQQTVSRKRRSGSQGLVKRPARMVFISRSTWFCFKGWRFELSRWLLVGLVGKISPWGRLFEPIRRRVSSWLHDPAGLDGQPKQRKEKPSVPFVGWSVPQKGEALLWNIWVVFDVSLASHPTNWINWPCHVSSHDCRSLDTMAHC